MQLKAAALLPSALHWVGLAQCSRSPQAEARTVGTDWHLEAVIFLVLHVSLGESFLPQNVSQELSRTKNKNHKKAHDTTKTYCVLRRLRR